MKKIFTIAFLFLIHSPAIAETLSQKKKELKEIYEAGGITKVEYEKSIEFLENQKKEEKNNSKKKFSKGTDKKTLKEIFDKKDEEENKEKITPEKIDELGKIIKFDKSYYPETMVKEFRGTINSFSGIGKKAGSYMWSNFGKSSSWGQKYPGKMIKSMAMYEIFYAARLYDTREAIKRFNEDNYKKGIFKKKKENDEDAIRSLFGMNKGRQNMREALGMDMDTPVKEAIQKFWLLGEFLEMGVPVDNNITVNKDIKDRQDRLDVYKATISTLKKKLEERAEEKKIRNISHEKN